MNAQKTIWSDLVTHNNSKGMLNAAIWHAAEGLSSMVGRTINTAPSRVEAVPIGQKIVHANDPEATMVGVYLLLEGGLRGHAILVMPLHSALNVADLMMENSLGTSTRLGAMERSALGEAGNVVISYFLNTVAQLSKAKVLLQPSRPTVLEGKLSTILDVLIAPAATVRDDLLVIETAFGDATGTVQGYFLVFPDPAITDLVA
ncbi:MAG: hypothetical protein SXV54_06735 [Chloroflexota bacterium]|nr:hypothetical protein [Chloroflexota bacterium]